jgi:hypothetical protein
MIDGYARVSTDGQTLDAQIFPSIRILHHYTRCHVTVSTPEPEGRARCVSSARRDPCGGRLATAAPTATISPEARSAGNDPLGRQLRARITYMSAAVVAHCGRAR